MRRGEIEVEAGYDGEYGTVKIKLEEKADMETKEEKKTQMGLQF